MKHHNISPSSFPKWEKCQSFVNDSSVDNEDRRQGAKNHKLLEDALIVYSKTGIVEDGLPEEVSFAVKKIDNYLSYSVNGDYSITPEAEISTLTDDFTNFFGHSDLLVKSSDRVIVVDYKDGKKAEYWGQIKAYCLGACQEHNVNHAVGMLIYGRERYVDVRFFELDELEKYVNGMVKYIKANVKTANPGEHCKWCKKRNSCVARNSAVKSLAKSGELDNISVDTDITELSTEKLSKLYGYCQVIDDYLKDVKEEMKKRLSSGEIVPGYRYKKKRGRASVKPESIPEIYEQSGLSIEEFMAKCSITLSSAKKMVDVENYITRGRDTYIIEKGD